MLNSPQQIDQLMNPKDPSLQNKLKQGQLPSHATMEDFLGRYCGLMLFVKEIDSGRYSQICSVSVLSSPLELHSS